MTTATLFTLAVLCNVIAALAGIAYVARASKDKEAAETALTRAERERDAYKAGVKGQARRATKAEVRADHLDSTVAMLQWELASVERAADWHEGSHTCLPTLDGIRALSATDVIAAVDRVQARRGDVVPIRGRAK